MFGVLYEVEGEKRFIALKTLDEAQAKAHTLSLEGRTVTVFDYDIESGEYMEFYTV